MTFGDCKLHLGLNSGLVSLKVTLVNLNITQASLNSAQVGLFTVMKMRMRQWIKSVQSGNVIDPLDVSQLATCISLQKIVYCSYRKSWRAIEVTSNNHIYSEISLQINIFYLMRQFNTLLSSIFTKEYFISLICSLQTQWSLDQSYQIL